MSIKRQGNKLYFTVRLNKVLMGLHNMCPTKTSRLSGSLNKPNNAIPRKFIN